MEVSKSRIKDLTKFLPITSGQNISIYIVSQTFTNNFPPPKNPFWVPSQEEDSSIKPLDIDPKFFLEEKAFYKMKDELYEKYPEKWVAISGGKVIDVDEDDGRLAERVYKKPGLTIYINKLTKESRLAFLSSPIGLHEIPSPKYRKD
ncbi:MAG: DUF5678 domain-containing protein [bacterium]